LKPIFKNLLQSEILLLLPEELVVLVNHEHTHSDITKGKETTS